MKKAFLALILIAFAFLSHAQNNVGIGTTNPNPEAILELFSTDKGFLLPRLNSTDIATNFTSPTEGMMFFAQDINRLMYFDGTSWQTLSFGDPSPWSSNGNDINNTNTGGVGIGINIPSAKFHVNQTINGAGAQQYISNTSNATNSSSGLSFTNSVPAQGYMIGIDNTSGIFKISNSSVNINAFNRLQIDPLGNVGIGNFAGVLSRLDVDGQITMRTGATIGYVPVSNANGTMTWTSPNTIGPWTKTGTNVYQTVLSDNVGIGINTPSAQLHTTGSVRFQGLPGGVLQTDAAGNLSIFPGSPVTGSGAINQLAFWSSASTIGTNFNLWWDNADSEFGIGITAPQRILHLHRGSASEVVTRYTNTSTQVGGSDGFDVGISTGGSAILRSFETTPMEFYTNNTERMRILGNGNVGIGTTTPANRLDVEGGVAIGAAFAGSNLSPTNGLAVQGDVGIGTNTPFNVSTRLTIDAPAETGFSGMYINTSATGEPFYGYGQNGVIAAYHYIDGASGAWRLFNNSTNDLVVASNGDVGIGTATPLYKFSVNGQANLNEGIASGAALRVNGAEALWYDGTYFSWGFGGNANFFADNVGIGTTTPVNRLDVEGGVAIGAAYSGTNAASANGLIVQGNVGIGTSSPTSKLQVDGGTTQGQSSALISSTDTWGTALNIAANGGGSAYQLVAAGSAHPSLSAGSFAISNLLTGNVFTIDGATGDVSIGALSALTTNKIGLGVTPTGASKVYIANTDDSFLDGMQINNTKTSGTAYGIYLNASTSSGTTYGVFSSASGASTGTKYGVFGSAGGSGTRYGLYCSGNGAYTGTWTLVSDQSLKKNIRNYQGALQNVMQLEPKQYQYRTDELPYMNMMEGEQIGLIAQDVQKVFPHVVSANKHPGPTDENGRDLGQEKSYLGIDYIQLVPILTQAIKEQQAQIEILKQEIELLKSK